MPSTLKEQIQQFQNTIADMEAQRTVLGEDVVQRAIEPLRAKLEELTRQLEASRATPGEKPAQQQRKLVSILFMDIVGSTSIIQHMDPEDVGEIFDANLKRLAQPVEDYGGRVTSFAGDAFLAIFGTPTAREDDPERAVRAGLAILERAEALAEELKKEWGIQDFKVRIGINTGMVLLGGETEGEDTTKGPAVHLAARLQSAAPAGGMLVSHDTYRHIRGVFDVEAMEPLQVKGFDDPVQVYRILRARPRAFRMYTRGVEGVETRMVGRRGELKSLQDALHSVIEDGEGQMVTIIGDAGVGKSRLLYELQDWIELQPQRVRFFEGRGRPEAQGLPYGLLRDMFAFRFQIQDDDSGEEACDKIEQGFTEIFGKSEAGEMRTHIMGQWLGFDFSDSPFLKGVVLDAEQLHNRGLMYLGEYFRGLSMQQGVVIFLEDIHWADDSTLDVINWLGQRMQHQRLLIVCAARPTLYERRPYWGEGLPFHHRINLEPLSRRESRELVEQILKMVDDIPPGMRDLVVDGAEGNPFYVEELIKMLVDEGVIIKSEEAWHIEPEKLAHIEVPSTLAGILQARLDSLPAQERMVLQQASVVGRMFWDRIVAYIQTAEAGGEEVVPEALHALRERELIYRREESAFAEAREYIFKHDILREVTYESVLKRLRRAYHGMVADWLIAQGSGRMDEYNGLIAGHLLQAGREEQACQFFVKAGEAALASYANGEADAHFSKALSLSPGRSLRAASLAGLGESLRARGLPDQAASSLREAIDLYFEMGEHDRVAYLYMLLASTLWFLDYQKAWEACQEGLERLQGVPDCSGMAWLLAEAGRAAYFTVQPPEVVESLCSQAIKMANHLGTLEPGLNASITLALVKKGDLETSLQMLEEASNSGEAHGLMGTAGRAHFNLGHVIVDSFGSSERVYQHYLKAAEIYRQIGDMDKMMFALGNIIQPRGNLGIIKSTEEFILKFLHNSSASETQINKFMRRSDKLFTFFRGEWKKTIESCRNMLESLHQGRNTQLIAEENFVLAVSTIDLYRFTGEDHLDEAEAAVLENMSMRWNLNLSQLELVRILANKGRFQEAHELLRNVAENPPEPLNRLHDFFILMSKSQLAMLEGDWEKAVSGSRIMVDMSKEANHQWRLARSLIDLGDAYEGRNQPSDRELAQEAYRQALEMFKGMDAPGFVRVLKERLGE